MHCFLYKFNSKVLLHAEKFDLKYAGILRMRFVYWTKAMAITLNTATTIPKGMYLGSNWL